MIPAPSTAFKREIVREFGGWREDLGSHEVSFMLQAIGLKDGVAYSRRPLYTFIMRPNSIGHHERRNHELTQLYYRPYVELMDEPPFDRLFSKTFAQHWLKLNWDK
jgi:hypothetical protein